MLTKGSCAGVAMTMKHMMGGMNTMLRYGVDT